MKSAVGPLPRFTEIHTQMALQLMDKHGRIGRKRLMEKLGIGEGSMRTIMEQLRSRGLIISSRGGHSLTEKGRKLLGTFPVFKWVDVTGLTVGKFSVATVVRGVAKKVGKGMEQRDEAIKVGADGATILVFKKGRLQFPDSFYDVRKKDSEMIIDTFKPREGDVIVIGTARDVRLAEQGARAAAETLC
jgi:predicted transcriptional regulator